jgi:predicted DNA-binding protein YlxM (UPF0122 family)
MAVTFTLNLNKEVSVEDHIRNTYGDQEFKIIGSRAYETVVYYTVESFYGAVFNAKVEYGGFDRDIPYLMVITKAANGQFFHIPANSIMDGYREVYQYEIDAPAEYKTEYAAHLAYNARKANVEKRLQDRKNMMEIAKEIGAPTYHVAKNLRNAANKYGDFNEVLKLLKSFKKGTIRSEFRMSLATQIFNWINDPAPQYNSPLTPKQFSCLRPFKAY